MAYRIKSVAALTGVPPETLRAWERRYRIVEPRRSSGGYRLYSDQDVATLVRIRSLVEQGLKVSEAVQRVRQGNPTVAAGVTAASAVEIDELRKDLLDGLLALDRGAATRAADRLVLLPHGERLEAVLMPILREIGERWSRGEATIVQEHFASAFIRELLIGMITALHGGPTGGREAICAGTPGELHELGLLGIAVHLALRGWRVTYLGADVPPESLRQLLHKHQPALLCTSLLTPRTADAALSYARELRAIAPPETHVVIGGAGIPSEVTGTPEPGLHLLSGVDELFAVLSEQQA